MISQAQKQDYYEAFIHKDARYEGVFFVGVLTTGIFCRPTCSARKPGFANCVFYKTAEEALGASYRPCLRCDPLSFLNRETDLVAGLLKALEADPSKKWTDDDLNKFSVDKSTIRRHFKKRFGITFSQYARAYRLGLAVKKLQEGDLVIDAQLSCGYESSSGFHTAFAKIMGGSPRNMAKNPKVLKVHWVDTPVGPMIIVGDEKAIYLLDFSDRSRVEKELVSVKKRINAVLIPGTTSTTLAMANELESYFRGELRRFQTSFQIEGTLFQKKVWEHLTSIPYGETSSYKTQAISIGKPAAYRAVANANGANPLAIVIPCHRIITNTGALGGYGGGVSRKEWLIAHEKKWSLRTL